MATNIVKMGLRPIFFLNGLKKCKLSTSTCCSMQNSIRPQTFRRSPIVYKFQPQSRYMSSAKRSVYQTKVSTSVNEDRKCDSDIDSDSDSDDENSSQKKWSQRSLSSFWRRKMRTMHSHLDVNKDGVISYDDFRLLGERFAELGNLTKKSKQEFEEVIKEMWEIQWGEISPYNFVGVEEYLERMHHILEDRSLRKKCHNFLPYLFKAVDKDGSGEISVEEFKLFFKCLGLHNDHAVVTFSYIDTNADGKISLKEFVGLGRDFFLSQDERRPSKHFWGPLVD